MLYLSGDYITKGYNMHDNPQQAVLYAYLAGIIDGEGCISMNKYSPTLDCFKNKNLKYKNPKYSTYLSIGMSCEEIVRMIAKEFDSSSVRIERVPNRKPIYRCKISGRKSIIKNLPKFMPYLIEKKAQAEIAMDFCTGFITPINRKKGLSEEELQRREELYCKIRKLNRSGAAATTE